MPGIAGIVGAHVGRETGPLLQRMLASMTHESRYSVGSHVDADRSVGIGAVCLPPVSPDRVAAWNDAKDVLLFLSGECLLDRWPLPRPAGGSADPTGARSIVRLYEEHGKGFVGLLNGWFAGVLLDLRTGSLLLFNDRYGMHRVYYHTDGTGTFYFASEAKALMRVVPAVRAIDPDAMGEYLCYDCVLDNRSLYAGVGVLPGGSCWEFARGDIVKARYFDSTEWENQDALPDGDVDEALGQTFSSVVPRYFTTGRTALGLTGGLDTRMTLAGLAPAAGQLPCFTFGGMYRDSHDVRIASRVARASGQPHRVVRLGRDFLAEYDRHVRRAIYISDGLANATNADELYLNREVAAAASVKLTGKFGSQVLRGVSGLRFRLPDRDLIAPDFRRRVDAAGAALFRLRRGNTLSFFLFYEIPWYWSGFTSLELAELNVRSPYLDNDFVRLLYRLKGPHLAGAAFQLRYIADRGPQLAAIATDQGLRMPGGGLAGSIASIRYRVQEKADKLYTWDRIPHGLTHWVARMDSTLSPLGLDRLVRGRSFFRHYRTWFRDELSGYLCDMLLDERTLQRPYWDRHFIQRMVADHVSGRANYLAEIRKVLTVELIHRHLISSGE